VSNSLRESSPSLFSSARKLAACINSLPLLNVMSINPQSLSGVEAVGNVAKKGLASMSARTSERGERNS